MLSNKNTSIIIALSFFILTLFYFLPFGIYGQDGYDLWFPIVAEYLNENRVYRASAVIFNGQNLASVYGELPFWKFLKILNVSIESFLNLTHAIWAIFFFIILITIVKGQKKGLNHFDILFCFLYSLFSPILANKVMAGHLNLLFGIFPFFALISLVYDKGWKNVLFLIFVIWCSLSMQSYQILTYHIFYIPILVWIIFKEEKDYKKYLGLSCLVLISAFLLNLPLFQEMYQHASNPDNLRSLGRNVVYSSLTSEIQDLAHFFFNDVNPLVLHRHLGFFHEINYPIGIFVILMALDGKNYQFKTILLISFTGLFLFCMNMAPFNFMAEFPLVQSFRVPQRVFMVPCLFLPVWCYSQQEFRLSKWDPLFLFGLIILSLALSQSDVVILVLVFISLILAMKTRNQLFQKMSLFLAIASLFSALPKKIIPSYLKHSEYLETKRNLQPLLDTYSREDLRKTVFHFNTHEKLDVLNSTQSIEEQLASGFHIKTPAFQKYNYVAQSLGIRTMEGYGHPPGSLINAVYDVTGVKFNPNSNWFYFFEDIAGKDKLLTAFTVDIVADVSREGKLVLKSLK